MQFSITETPYPTEEEALIHAALKCLEKQLLTYGIPMDCPQATINYLRLQLATEKNEVFGVLFLDIKRHVIAFEKLFFGTIHATTIHPRVVLQKAMAHNAAAVIFSHNHPSGAVDPSAADIAITQRLKTVLNLVDVCVLDHVIVSTEGYCSLAARGLV